MSVKFGRDSYIPDTNWSNSSDVSRSDVIIGPNNPVPSELGMPPPKPESKLMCNTEILLFINIMFCSCIRSMED